MDQKQTKATRRRYSPEFNNEALGLAEQVGVSGAAKQLGLHQSQLYTWRKKARYEASRSETDSASAYNARPLAGPAAGITLGGIGRLIPAEGRWSERGLTTWWPGHSRPVRGVAEPWG